MTLVPATAGAAATTPRSSRQRSTSNISTNSSSNNNMRRLHRTAAARASVRRTGKQQVMNTLRWYRRGKTLEYFLWVVMAEGTRWFFSMGSLVDYCFLLSMDRILSLLLFFRWIEIWGIAFFFYGPFYLFLWTNQDGVMVGFIIYLEINSFYGCSLFQTFA